MSRCEDARLQLGGYVLDGLEPEEAREVDEHLEACPDCAAEAAELATLPPLLGLLEEAPSGPPAAMRDRVLGGARRRRVARRCALGVAAALAVAAVASVGWLVGATGLGDAPTAQTAWTTPLEAEATDASGELTVAPTGAGLLVQLDVRGLDEIQPPATYEAWLRQPGREEPVSIGQFHARAGERTVVTFTAAGTVADYAGFWVTAEPDAADPAHRGETLLWADLPSGS